jgi:flagellar biosynthesis protein
MSMKNQKTSKRNSAIALKYRVGLDSAPRLVAKGKGLIADKIVEIAKRHHVPIHFDPQLTEALSYVSIHEIIPEHLYAVVAEVLAWVYSLEEKQKR